MKLKIYTDGGARNNPGPAGIGIVIYNENDKIIKEHKEYIGEATNNVAEYQAVVKALEIASTLKAENLDFYIDSELVVKQLKGLYKVKDEKMKKLFDEVKVLSMGFASTEFTHIKREKNVLADKLVNEAIDER